MASLLPGDNIGRDLCKLLGLDSTECRRVVIDLPHDGLVRVWVEKYMDVVQVEPLKEWVGKYAKEFLVTTQTEAQMGGVKESL